MFSDPNTPSAPWFHRRDLDHDDARRIVLDGDLYEFYAYVEELEETASDDWRGDLALSDARRLRAVVEAAVEELGE